MSTKKITQAESVAEWERSARRRAQAILLRIGRERFDFESEDDWDDYAQAVDVRIFGSRCHTPPPLPALHTAEEWHELADTIYVCGADADDAAGAVN